MQAQRALQTEAWNPYASTESGERAHFTLAVRMALHTGTVQLRGADYFGTALSRVARLVAAGHGGQILLSAATADLVRDHLPPEVALHDLGAHWLRRMARPEQIFQLCTPDLPDAFPPLATMALPVSNLPVPTTTFIGRAHEVAALTDMLTQPDARLVTLTGPGGTGKTRLALQASSHLCDHDQFPNGVWFVNLAPISDPNLIATAIVQALDVRQSGEQPSLDSVKSYLRAKRMLLLLDNFEQVVEAAPLVSELLAAAPGLTVLVTSRMPLRLSGEHEWAVPPLALPPQNRVTNSEQVGQHEAVQLFVDHARAVKADFALTNKNALAVADICRALDGLPLAIELAAARVKLFAPAALLARLANRLPLLTGGPRDAPTRHQTLRDTLDWSFHLLTKGEQTLFARLGVFVGGCTLEAAEAGCNADGDLPFDVLDGLAALVNHSMLRQEEGPDGEPRFVMLETIRAYALERLEAGGEAELLRAQHADYYLGLTTSAGPHFDRATQIAWGQQLEQEQDNLRAALAWRYPRAENLSLELQFAAVLVDFWTLSLHPVAALIRGEVYGINQTHHTKLHIYLAEMLTRYQTQLGGWQAAVIQERLGLMTWIAGDGRTAIPLLEESQAVFQQIGDRWGSAVATFNLIRARADSGQILQHTISQLLDVLEQFRQIGDHLGYGQVLTSLGEAARLSGDYEHAARYHGETLAIDRALGNRAGISFTLSNFGWLAYNQGDTARAENYVVESLLLARGDRDQQGIAYALAILGFVAVSRGQAERAARLLGATKAPFDADGALVDAEDRAEFDRNVAAARAQLGEEAFATAWAAGQALPLEQAVAEALSIEETDHDHVRAINDG